MYITRGVDIEHELIINRYKLNLLCFSQVFGHMMSEVMELLIRKRYVNLKFYEFLKATKDLVKFSNDEALSKTFAVSTIET